MNARELHDKLEYEHKAGLRWLFSSDAQERETVLRALRLLAAAEANDGSTPGTDAVLDQWVTNHDGGVGIMTDHASRLERERNGLAARVRELEHAVDLAARTMAGEGVEDQGQAWDKCLRILDAARSK